MKKILKRGQNMVPIENLVHDFDDKSATTVKLQKRPLMHYTLCKQFLQRLGVTQLILVDTWDRLDKPARHVG
jgi:hypothetical protein